MGQTVKVEPVNYAMIYFDGCNGWRFGGIISKKEIEMGYPNANSRNDDGLLELDEMGTLMAVPCSGDAFMPEPGEFESEGLAG
jgi:hypothetical protein